MKSTNFVDKCMFFGIVAIVCIFFAGCVSHVADSSSQTLSAASPDAAADAAAQQTQTSASSFVPQSSPEITAKYAAFVDKQSTLSYSAPYQFTTTSADVNTSVVMTSYYDGLNKIRFDTAAGGGAQMRIYTIDGKATSCMNFTGSWQCTVSGSQYNPASGADTNSTISDLRNIVSLQSRTIAGVAASCFGVTQQASSDTLEFCYAHDGVPLYRKTTITDPKSGVQHVSEMTALSYSMQLPSDAFVLPQN